MTAKKNLVVIGNAMVGHKFLELMLSSGASATWNLITFCEEPRVAYDRVNLSAYFSGKTAADLSLVQPGLYQENNIQIHIGDQAVAINREQKTVSSRNGLEVAYDKIVLATGSYPFVPPIKGNDATGTFVYRTIGDRGGIVINDQCQTSDPDIYAIGECALYQNRIYGLVAPGYTMAGVVADVFNNVTTSTFAKIWKRLVDAGFESGHAYGKALRTVKSCVGSTWCRYGVQDSTSLAIELELRYRGLRSPHKLKSAVSGCTRECAEAQSKDFGVILVGISE